MPVLPDVVVCIFELNGGTNTERQRLDCAAIAFSERYVNDVSYDVSAVCIFEKL